MAPKKPNQIQPMNLKPLIKQLEKEKELEPEVIKSAVESAILSAAQKRAKSFTDARPNLDLQTGELRMYVKKKVVVHVADEKHEIDILSAKAQNSSYMLGMEVDVEIDPEEFGRIAAQSVRQGILQRLRDAERDRIYNHFKDKVGEVVTAIMQRYERHDAIVSLGKIECLIPKQEVPMGVRYRYGDRVRCLIVDVRRAPKGPQVILSRTRSELVKQLFKVEVPEINDGVVRIVEIAREPGVRTKIAVQSMDANVDPVGACVGMKGSRVQMIVRELDNEKVDIVPWSPIPENFITSALNPAQIVNIRLSPVEKRAEVVVERESLSKAIGKRGQNAKLAAKLTGWKIDISEQEEAETLARLDAINQRYLEDFLSQIQGVPEIVRAALARSKDYNSVEKLAQMEPRDLLNFTNDSIEQAEKIIEGAQEYLEGVREMSGSSSDVELPADQAEFLRGAEDLANRLSRSFSAAPEDLPTPEDAPLPTDEELAALERNDKA
ncbi:transcription termination/antitermination protein NusA [bacterium]|nr:transcription termination/antitermination protein NusA [bacterium]